MNSSGTTTASLRAFVMAAIFISYRDEDAGTVATVLRDSLIDAFGDEHVACPDPAGGYGAGKTIDSALHGCAAALIVIGPRWLTSTNDSGSPGLNDRDDRHRRLIAAALAQHDLKLIPVLVGGASMPRSEDLPEEIRALAERRPHDLGDEGERFVYLRDLITDLEASTGLVAKRPIPPIFISYRRIDTLEAGGHLYGDLRRAFGENMVFMDVRRTGIAWGAEWDKALLEALDRCQAMVVLIGPQWATCERSPGVRRLDAPDDWVRNEIATALKGSKLVLPVRLRDAPVLAPEQIPEELRTLGFDKRQSYPISEANWDSEVAGLVEALTSDSSLRQLHVFATSETGIRKLEELIRTRPDVADAVSRSRLVIESTDREVGQIRLFKDVHDALHEIEVECLKPVRSLSLDSLRRRVAQPSRMIRGFLDRLHAECPNLPLLERLPDQLTAVSAAIDQAIASGHPDDRELVVFTLTELVGVFLPRLNEKIDNAATQIQLQQLSMLIRRVGEDLPARVKADAELKPLFRSIQPLESLNEELAQRVHEHDLLQSLDDFLRQMLAGQRADKTAARLPISTLTACWNRITSLRERFAPPLSVEVRAGLDVLDTLAPPIDAAVLERDEQRAVDHLSEYFVQVGATFREVDTNLKEFCHRLRDTTLPLKTILEQCRSVEVGHV